MGKLPKIFNGDRTKADDFIEEVKGYLCLNAEVAGFDSPMKKITFTLTHMKGPEVAGWVHDIGHMLDGLNPLVDNIPFLWEQFLNEFEAQYLDTAREDQARAALHEHKIKGEEIDAYISKFEELAHQANYTTGSPETLRLFLQGLNRKIVDDIYKPLFPQGYTQTKERAIQSITVQRIINGLWQNKGAMPNRFQSNPFQPFNRMPRWLFYNNNIGGAGPTPFNSSNALKWMNNQMVPMDLGRTRAPPWRGQRE